MTMNRCQYMLKNDINQLLRRYVKDNLSLSDVERDFVTKVYKSFQSITGNNCIQIGSYSRFTSIKPLHDLDILYFLGDWNQNDHDPHSALASLSDQIISSYINPTKYSIKTSIQTHSVTISYLEDNEKEVFSVDIVPAYAFKKNEFGLDMYKIPEVMKKRHGYKRQKYYQKLIDEKKEMNWINSDPKGYTQVATNLNSNADFRKSVKFLKAWAKSYKDQKNGFKLKSFHIEQVVSREFENNSSLCIFDAIFIFFTKLTEIISRPQILDRADNKRFIDDYLIDLSQNQKTLILKAKDYFLITLENIDVYNVDNLLCSKIYERSLQESFLFDKHIPVLIESKIEITGCIQDKNGNNFRLLSNSGYIDNGLFIKFVLRSSIQCDYFLWKVKNDNNCIDPRGEITKSKTKNVPEKTVYPGSHYVECFAIKDSVCIARTKQNVVIKEKLFYK